MVMKKAWKRIAFCTVAVLAVFIFGAWGFIAFEPFRHDALTYETPPSCASSSTPWENKLSAQWEQETFLIRASEFPNCAESVTQVSAQVIGSQVLLRIRYEAASGPRPACRCEKLTIIRLSGLAKRDYAVTRIGSP